MLLIVDYTSFPMMPLYLIPVDTVIFVTIVEVFNFQDLVYRTLSAVRNYTLFETLLLVNSPFNLLASNKLNTRIKRKIKDLF